jgi:hypothetical protein
VLVTCWSVKGGVGTTVVAAALAVQLAHDGAPGVVLADLAGDLPAVLGLAEPDSPGLAGWLAAGPGVPADALARIEVDVAPGLALLPRGDGPLRPERAAVLAAVLERSPRTAVVDCGRAVDRGWVEEAVAGAVIERSRQSLLVTRPCFVALRRAARAPHRPTAVVLVNEPGRVLGGADVERLVRAPVTQIEIDPAVARLVDTGVLMGRIPRSLHPLRGAA